LFCREACGTQLADRRFVKKMGFFVVEMREAELIGKGYAS
jgi:hypothetical protein